jgi:predicted DNA-binding helix-hairpin-helix protein
MSEFESLDLGTRINEALEESDQTMRSLLALERSQLIDLPGIGATSADRIVKALDAWVARSLAGGDLDEVLLADPRVPALLAACEWAQNVLYALGNQRGMFLGAQMMAKVKQARSLGE